MQHLKHLMLAAVLSSSVFLPVAAEEIQARYSDSLTLSMLSDKVYQSLPGKLGEGKFARLQEANDALTDSLFAQPATANLNHFNDAIGSGDGFQEWEGGIDMPLWLPGQKQAQQSLSQQLMAELPAYQARLQLQASAEVRQLVWQVKLAEAELEQATLVWQTAQKLEQDVKKRVEAGDMPPTEGLLASSNTLEKHGLMAEAESRLEQQLETYRLITGEQQLPAQVTETLGSASNIPASHPQLAMQDQVIARLQAELGIAEYAGAANPNLSVGVRRERGDDKESFNHSMGVGISIALDDSRYSQPAVAEASAALAEAQVQRREIERQLKKTLLARQQTLKATRKQLELITEQNKTTQDYYQLQKRAFDLGELNLLDLLRSQVRANDSRNRKHQLQVQVEQNIAAVNQALGVVL
jgi:outer membrane protein TolC